MKSELSIEILNKTLLPFIAPRRSYIHAGQRPKHAATVTRDWLCNNSIKWWKTLAESPDFNPIENLWHELKEYIRREVKPKTIDELMRGIDELWGTVDQAKCLNTLDI